MFVNRTEVHGKGSSGRQHKQLHCDWDMWRIPPFESLSQNMYSTVGLLDLDASWKN